MYSTLLSLIIIFDLVITSPVHHVETTSPAVHKVKHVSIKSVKTYLNKTRFEAKDLVSEFQDVIQNSPHDADIDQHRHVAKGYLPKAIQTIVAMKEATNSILRRIDENGLESPQVLGGKRDCHQLKKSIDAIKEVAVENLCSKLNREEIIAYFKSDLNCLLGSIFELWRASERDGTYFTLGYRDIIQTIKNLLEAIENGTRRFAEEIEYMDISKECSKFVHQKQLAVSRESKSENKVPGDEGKTEEENKAKDGGKGVHANTVVVSGKVNTFGASLVDKVEEVLNLEKKELNEIKAVAEKEIEKVGGAGNVSVGLVGVHDTKNTDEKKEDKVEQKEDGEGKEEEEEGKEENETANANAESEKEVKKAEVKEAETEKEEEEEEKEEEEKEKEKNVTESEKTEEGGEVKEEKKEEEKEQSEENEVEKVESEEENVTEHTPVVVGNATSDNHTNELSDDIDKKLKVILTNEENNLNAILHKLDENNQTAVEKIDKVKEEKHEIKNMLKELETVKVNLDTIDAVKKNKSIETDDEEHKDSNVTIIDVIRKSPVLTTKLIPRVGIIIPKNENTNVTVKEAMPWITPQPAIQQKVSIPPETNVKDLENEEKSLEVLRTFGQGAFPASNITQPKSNSEDEQLKADVVPETAVTGGVKDIDAQEEKNEEEKAKEMVEKFKEEEEKEQEKKEQVMEPEINANVTNMEDEKEEERKEQKKETIMDSKPVEKMAVTTNKPSLVPAESKNKNNTLEDLISKINDEEVQVRNLIQKLNG